MNRMSKAASALRIWLVALLAILPAAAAAATVVLFTADWPEPGNRGLQLAVALAAGAVFWVLAALLVGPEVSDVESASSDSYADLRGRVLSLDARLGALSGHSRDDGGAFEEAQALVRTLKSDLRLDGGEGRTGGTRWLLGHGYVNAWREVHAAEDTLLRIEEPDVALALLGIEADLASIERQIDPHAGLPTGERFRSRNGPQLVSRRLAQLHKAENDAWDKIVNLRNRLFLTLVLAVTLTYAVLALAVLRDVTAPMMTAGVAFFLVGAVVGVFNELYLTSRPGRKGSVFDYGLGHVRLLVTPVLSGLAGLGGVLITTMTGPFLVSLNGQATTPDLTAIFNLQTYSMGLVVAAIFGLTPALLLTRLRDRTDAYKQEIEEASPGSSATRAAPRTAAPLIPVGR